MTPHARPMSATLRRIVLLVIATVMVAGCGRLEGKAKRRAARLVKGTTPGWSPASLKEVKGVPVEALRTAITKRLAGERPPTVSEDAWGHAKKLYERYQQTPLWLVENGLARDRAGALTEAVLNATADAIMIDEYPIADLANSIAAVRRTKQPTAEQLAEADVLLTAVYAALGEDLLVGQVDPRKIGQSWHIDAKDENVDSALTRTIDLMPLSKAISALRPEDDGYLLLQKELGRYREIVAKGDFPAVPAGRRLKRGDADSPARLAALRARLAAEGIDVAAAPASPAASQPAPATGAHAKPARTPRDAAGVFDASLAAAVAQFQERHGISVDSSLGEETVNALNVPAAYRLGQIAANLERMRWLPRELPERYIHVNVAAFQVQGFDEGEKSIEMKVIVGQEYEGRSTPVFADSMETVVFRPYWNITPEIQAKEIGPKVASDPGYLAANDMEYFRDGSEMRIRQRPGPRNALGFVKFLFPNDFNIYLHDTPNHELFEKDVRAFSHGCIRLERPAELAQWVLGWDAAQVEEAMHSGGDNRSVRLPKKIPVFITYNTAYVRDGKLFFGNDLYHRDDALVKSIAEGALPSARAVQALEALKRIAEG